MRCQITTNDATGHDVCCCGKDFGPAPQTDNAFREHIRKMTDHVRRSRK